MITEFIWNKKPACLKYEKLIQDYQSMGLKLVDIESKNHALKVSWINKWKCKKVINDIPWLYTQLPVKDERMWLCNLETKDVNRIFNTKLDMGVEILKSWSMINFSTTFTIAQYSSTPIWFNSLIKRANKPIVNLDLISSNINTVADIWDRERRRFVYSTEINDIHDMGINFLQYNSIISAIPRMWKHHINNWDWTEVVPENNLPLFERNLTSQEIYWIIIKTKHLGSDASCLLWAKDLQLDNTILENQWETILLNSRFITNASKLRSLQYKILARSVVTNIRRLKWDATVTPNCTFCCTESETIMHLFVKCTQVVKLWVALEKWVDYFYRVK